MWKSEVDCYACDRLCMMYQKRCGLIGPNSFGAMPAAQNTMLIDLCTDDPEYVSVNDQLQNSIREHKDNCGGIFTRYHIVKVCSQ